MSKKKLTSGQMAAIVDGIFGPEEVFEEADPVLEGKLEDIKEEARLKNAGAQMESREQEDLEAAEELSALLSGAENDFKPERPEEFDEEDAVTYGRNLHNEVSNYTPPHEYYSPAQMNDNRHPSAGVTAMTLEEWEAQEEAESEKLRIESSRKLDTDNPQSPDFTVCVNAECPYKAECLRYRMSNRRDNSGIFFPDECRKDGVYISIRDTEFTGYDPLEVLEPVKPRTSF